MLCPPAPVIRSSPFDVGALLNACIIIIIIINAIGQIRSLTIII